MFQYPQEKINLPEGTFLSVKEQRQTPVHAKSPVVAGPAPSLLPTLLCSSTFRNRLCRGALCWGEPEPQWPIGGLSSAGDVLKIFSAHRGQPLSGKTGIAHKQNRSLFLWFRALQ